MPQTTSRRGTGGSESARVVTRAHLPARSTACARISVLTILARSPALGIWPSSTICACIEASLSMGSGSFGRDRANLYGVVKDEGRAGIVGLGIGRFGRERDGFVPVREGIAQRLRLRGQIADRILASLR